MWRRRRSPTAANGAAAPRTKSAALSQRFPHRRAAEAGGATRSASASLQPSVGKNAPPSEVLCAAAQAAAAAPAALFSR